MDKRLFVSIADLNIEINYINPQIPGFFWDYQIQRPDRIDLVATATEAAVEEEKKKAQQPVSPWLAEESALFRRIAEKAPLLGRFLMHGAAVSYGEKGYLFTALSGTGKSTHISLWKQYLGDQVDIINGDKPLIHVEKEKISICATPWAGKENWQRNCKYPLGGICLVQRGTENRIRRIQPARCLNLLLQQIYMPKDPGARTATFGLVDQVLGRVPVYLLECDISEEAVETSFPALTGEAYRRSEKPGSRPWNGAKEPKNPRKIRRISNQSFESDGALQGCRDLEIVNCAFDGPEKGQGALKESRNITAKDCRFSQPRPFQHGEDLCITDSEMTETCGEALWYSKRIAIRRVKLHGAKALRECGSVLILNGDIISPEFGWSVKGMTMGNSTAIGPEFMRRSTDLKFFNVEVRGRNSFQFVRDSLFENCVIDSREAFLQGENITLRNCLLKGEHLGWHSKGLTLENCKVIGSQPLVGCENLKLIHCEITDTEGQPEESQPETASD